ncbi:MAG: hypothetical protein PHW04_18850 [Candidatus Wallbacteria bacterium]|nr:hypothetical protein [Candidatus Wallbacteria bacterium]
MIKCPGCSKFLRDGLESCPACGTELPRKEAPKAAPAPGIPPKAPANETVVKDEPARQKHNPESNPQPEGTKAEEAFSQKAGVAADAVADAVREGAGVILKGLNSEGFDVDVLKRYLTTGLQMALKDVKLTLTVGALLALVPMILGVIPLIKYIAPLYGILISPILIGGFYYYCFKLAKNQPAAKNDLKAGLPLALPLVIAGLIMMVAISIGMAILIIPGIFVSACLIFTYPLIMDRRMDFMTAIKTSVNTVLQGWVNYFIFTFVLAVLNALGAICIGVGLMLTIPWTIAAISVAYNDVFKIESVQGA